MSPESFEDRDDPKTVARGKMLLGLVIIVFAIAMLCFVLLVDVALGQSVVKTLTLKTGISSITPLLLYVIGAGGFVLLSWGGLAWVLASFARK